MIIIKFIDSLAKVLEIKISRTKLFTFRRTFDCQTIEACYLPVF